MLTDPPVKMFWFPEAVAVAEFVVAASAAPAALVAISALPVSEVGACEAFMPSAKVGVVPAVME